MATTWGMRRNFLILAAVLIAAALFTYLGHEPDLIASRTEAGSGIRVHGPAAESSLVYLRSSSGHGFQGTWTYGIASADFPSSHVTTRSLTLDEDGTAALGEESRHRVNSEAGALEYRTETKTRRGTWLQHGEQAWIELD